MYAPWNSAMLVMYGTGTEILGNRVTVCFLIYSDFKIQAYSNPTNAWVEIIDAPFQTKSNEILYQIIHLAF